MNDIEYVFNGTKHIKADINLNTNLYITDIDNTSNLYRLPRNKNCDEVKWYEEIKLKKDKIKLIKKSGTFSHEMINDPKIKSYPPTPYKNSKIYFKKCKRDPDKYLGPSVDEDDEDENMNLPYCENECLVILKPVDRSRTEENEIAFRLTLLYNYVSSCILPKSMKNGIKNILIVCNDTIIFDIPEILIRYIPTGCVILPLPEIYITGFSEIYIRIYYENSAFRENIPDSDIEFMITTGFLRHMGKFNIYIPCYESRYIKTIIKSNQERPFACISNAVVPCIPNTPIASTFSSLQYNEFVIVDTYNINGMIKKILLIFEEDKVDVILPFLPVQSFNFFYENNNIVYKTTFGCASQGSSDLKTTNLSYENRCNENKVFAIYTIKFKKPFNASLYCNLYFKIGLNKGYSKGILHLIIFRKNVLGFDLVMGRRFCRT